MNPLELELLRLKMRVEILERLALKGAVQIALGAAKDLDKAVDLVIGSIQVNEDLPKAAWGHLDAAQLALHEEELREIVEKMHAFLNLLRRYGKPAA
ncbi:MAG TPA: hypothetical protein VI229_08160 [Burkholderiales bacterium]